MKAGIKEKQPHSMGFCSPNAKGRQRNKAHSVQGLVRFTGKSQKKQRKKKEIKGSVKERRGMENHRVINHSPALGGREGPFKNRGSGGH